MTVGHADAEAEAGAERRHRRRAYREDGSRAFDVSDRLLRCGGRSMCGVFDVRRLAGRRSTSSAEALLRGLDRLAEMGLKTGAQTTRVSTRDCARSDSISRAARKRRRRDAAPLEKPRTRAKAERRRRPRPGAARSRPSARITNPKLLLRIETPLTGGVEAVGKALCRFEQLLATGSGRHARAQRGIRPPRIWSDRASVDALNQALADLPGVALIAPPRVRTSPAR